MRRRTRRIDSAREILAVSWAVVLLAAGVWHCRTPGEPEDESPPTAETSASEAGDSATDERAVSESEKASAERSRRSVDDLDASRLRSALESLARQPGMRHDDPKGEAASAIQKRIDSAPDGSVVRVPPGTHVGTVRIEGRKNVTLKAAPGTAWIAAEDRTVDVITVSNSASITIEGLGVLHRTPGYCDGNAIDIYKSRDITIRDCDLSGSGVEAVSASGVAGLTVEHNHIHHSTYRTVKLWNSFGVAVRDNLIRENAEHGGSREGLSMSKVYGPVTIASNTFADNDSTPITFHDAELPEDEALSPANIVVKNNVFRNSQSPRDGKSASIGPSEDLDDDWRERVDALEVVDNCFDTSYGRDSLDTHVLASTSSRHNHVGPVRLDDQFQVERPRACRDRGAPAIGWLEKARTPSD